ncbi:MAG: hypothetical protein H0X24_15285 [Ktedonobacterales bacterium]|nr:hypothetical protein [Ktedonobacterales bacterium]
MKQRDPIPATYPATNGGYTSTSTDAEERKKMGRRALIAAAGLGVVGVAVAEKDRLLQGAGDLAQQEIQNAFNAGRRALAEELASLEGVGIDLAVDVADITHNAVSFFVIPIVKLLTGVTEFTLDIADQALIKAQQFSQLLHVQIQALDFLHGVVETWKSNVAAFPVVAESLNNVDTQNAKTYLAALKTKLQREASK